MNGLILHRTFGNLIYFLSNVHSSVHVNYALAIHLLGCIRFHHVIIYIIQPFYRQFFGVFQLILFEVLFHTFLLMFLGVELLSQNRELYDDFTRKSRTVFQSHCINFHTSQQCINILIVLRTHYPLVYVDLPTCLPLSPLSIPLCISGLVELTLSLSDNHTYVFHLVGVCCSKAFLCVFEDIIL